MSLELWLFAAYAHQQFSSIQQQLGKIMATVTVDQAALDALAQSLETVKSNLAAEIASLQTAQPAADLTGLNNALSDLQSLQAPAPAPASAAPADTSSTDTSTPPADTIDAPPTDAGTPA